MRYRVGYALKPEKIGSVVQPSLITRSFERGINLIEVELTKPLVDQGPFHCLVHKLYTPEWKSQLTDFQTLYPDTIIIDSPLDIKCLHNRASMLDVVNPLTIPLSESQSQYSIGIPRQMVVNDQKSLLSEGCLELTFPVIAKPVLANGTNKAHEMALVFTPCSLSKVASPVVLQEFVNHGGVLFKVYVAGNHVKCVTRTSLNDISKEQLEGDEGFMPFSLISSLDVQGQQELEQPPLEVLRDIAKGLREASNLHLFNFDLIRDVSGAGSKYFIIDINYFPGYASVPGFETMLTDFFWDIFQSKSEEEPDLC